LEYSDLGLVKRFL